MPNPLSPPVVNYSIIINIYDVSGVIDTKTVTALDVRENVAIDIGSGNYTVTVIANNDIGPSSESMPLDIGKA